MTENTDLLTAKHIDCDLLLSCLITNQKILYSYKNELNDIYKNIELKQYFFNGEDKCIILREFQKDSNKMSELLEEINNTDDRIQKISDMREYILELKKKNIFYEDKPLIKCEMCNKLNNAYNCTDEKCIYCTWYF